MSRRASKSKKSAANQRGPQATLNTRRDRLLSSLLASSEGRALIAVGRRFEMTTADAVSPPGSLLDVIVRVITQHTDLPPVLGVVTCFAMLSSALAESGSHVEWYDDPHKTEFALWLLMLAGSGEGKTWLREVLCEALGLSPRLLPEPGSPEAFIDKLQELNGRALWMRDEFGQLLAKMKQQGGPLSGLRDVMLQSYDHSTLQNSTRKRGDITVDRPVLNVFGASVLKTWGDCIDSTMLVDGLMQRHLFVVADSRPLDVPRYPRALIVRQIRDAASIVGKRTRSKVAYVITKSAAAMYDSAWRSLVKDLGDSLDRSYIRRITWSAARYAAIYHILLGHPGARVGVSAMRWAWRMTALHMHSTRLVLSLSDRTLAGRVDRIASWIEGRQREGVDIRSPEFRRRLLMQFKRDLSSVTEANQIIQLCTPMPTKSGR